MQTRLEDVLEDVLKTSWKRFEDVWGRCLEDVLGRRIANTSWRRLQEVLEDEKCYAEDVLENKKCLLGLVQFGSEYSRIFGVSVVYDKSINSALIIKALR